MISISVSVHVSYFMFVSYLMSPTSVEAGKISLSGVVEGGKGDERLWRERGGGGGYWVMAGDTRHLSSLQLSDVIDRTRTVR